MKVGIFVTGQHPPGSDMIAALDDQYAMTRLARDRGWDAVATGQHYLSPAQDHSHGLAVQGLFSRSVGPARPAAGVLGLLAWG